MDLPLLLSELRRRRVGRVVIGYGLVTFALLQVIEPLLHALHLGDWLLSVAVLALGLGFPVAVALAWAFDLKPGGIERTAPLPARAAPVAPPAAEPAPTPTLAVLPFADLSAERDQDYFCEGIAEELLGALCCFSGLRVVARSSSFQFKGRSVDAREVGRLLGATALLEGSVRKAGSRIRVTARLVDARQGLELWSEQFDRQLEDTFAVQEEIAQALVRALRLTLSSAERDRLRKVGASRATRDPRAYELYLRGRHRLMAHGENVFAACDVFRQAIALDPAFAQAHAGLADAAVFLLTWNLDPPHVAELRAEALAASDQALRLEPELAEARLAHANVLTILGRLPEAEQDFRRAIEANPGWGDACYFYARALSVAGRYGEAAGAFEEAIRRNPDDFASLALLANAHLRLNDPAGAREASRRGLLAVERRLALDPDDVRALYLGASFDIECGDRSRAFQRMERAVALASDFATLYNGACFYARAGQVARALDLLERAVVDGRGSRAWIEQDPDLDPLRADPRFQAILARVKG
jgi:adenylate cyclase